eukprot:29385-Pelagococcus_subviridis.AAC.1
MYLNRRDVPRPRNATTSRRRPPVSPSGPSLSDPSARAAAPSSRIPPTAAANSRGKIRTIARPTPSTASASAATRSTRRPPA